MSSGEADRVRYELARSGSLDAFTRCRAPMGDCEWMVHLPATLCPAHGGPRELPRYYADAEGAIVAVSHMPQRDGQ